MNKLTNKFVWILLIVFAFNITVFSAFAEEQTADTDTQKAENVLTALGILTKSGVNYEHEVTRQEFADIAVRLINTDYGFRDNSGAEDGYGSISALIDMGYMVGYEDGTYRPENVLTGEETVKIIVSMLGYWYPAEQKGGYPTGYIAQASALGILDNIKTNLSDGLSYGALIDMLYKMIDVDVMAAEYNGANVVNRAAKDETILSVYRNIYKAEGIVTSNIYTSLSSVKATKKNQIKIDDVLYECDLEGAESYIGYCVDYYYQEENSGRRRILYIDKNGSNNELTVYSEDIMDYDGNIFRYYDDNKVRNVKVDFAAAVIVNNKFKSEIAEADFCPKYGSVRFIDAENDGKYETVIIENIELTVVGTVNSKEGKIFDKYTKKEVIDIDEYSSVEVVCEGKVYDNLSLIREEDVAEIKRADYDDAVTIVIHRESLTGIVESSSLVGENKYITVNKEQYLLSEYAAQLLNNSQISILIGSGYKFYLNTRGQIAGCEFIDSSSRRYGYIISFSDENDAKRGYFIRILDQSDEKIIFEFAEHFKVDGVNYKDKLTKVQANSLKNMLENRLVIYSINLNGKIISIDTEERGINESSDSLVKLNTVDNADYRKFKSGVGFEGKILVNDNTIVFVVPTQESGNSEDYEFYRVLSVSDFVVNGKYSLTGYNSTGYEYISDAVVVHDSGNKISRSPYDKKPMFINRVGTMIDENNEIKIKLEGYIDGVQTKVGVLDNRAAGDNAAQLSPGDIVDLVESNNGEVMFGKPGASTFLVDLDEQGKPNYLYTGSSNYSSTYLYRFKGVHRVDGKYLELGNPNDILNADGYELINTSNAVIFVYDKDMGEFRTGTENDIISYEMSQDSYSKVFLLSSNSFFYLAVYNN